MTISFSGGSSATTKIRIRDLQAKSRRIQVADSNATFPQLKDPGRGDQKAEDASPTICGQLHYSTMYSFTRYKIDNAEYKSFLLQTAAIAFPGRGRQDLESRSLSANGQVD